MSKSENKKSAPPKTPVASKTAKASRQIEPTSRPWIVKHDNNTGLAIIASPVKPNGNRDKVAVFPMMMPNDLADSNAELICRAVNNHEELLAALKSARNIIIGSDCERVWVNAPIEPSISFGEMLDAAIANAEKALTPPHDNT